ncbi:hypothetical protein Tco_1118829 [Tanacetum coccineum]
MSFPNHPTSNIEDAFSSNFLNYIPASLDYSPTSQGNTYSSSSNNSFEFFLPEELLPLKKRGRDRSSSFTSALPQAFKIGESSRKTSLECYKEQIEEILNHLDELSLDRIEHIEDKNRRSWKRLCELQKACAQIAKLQRKQLGNNSKISLARFRIANLEQIIEDIQVRHQEDKEKCLPKGQTSEAPAMTQATIRKQVADSVTATLEAQATTLANVVTPQFLHIAAEANLGYYFKGTTVIIIENESKRVVYENKLSFIISSKFLQMRGFQNLKYNI